MKRSKFWSASIMMSIIIIVVSAYSMFGLVLGQESGSSEGAGEAPERPPVRAVGEHGGGEQRRKGSGGGEGSMKAAAAGTRRNERAPMLLALDETYDVTRNGARLIMRYDAASNQFIGTVQNTTNSDTGAGTGRDPPVQRRGAGSNDPDRSGSGRNPGHRPGRWRATL